MLECNAFINLTSRLTELIQLYAILLQEFAIVLHRICLFNFIIVAVYIFHCCIYHVIMNMNQITESTLKYIAIQSQLCVLLEYLQ